MNQVNKTKFIIPILLCLLLFVYIPLKLDFRRLFIADTLLKTIQAYSLKISGYSDESLFYEAKNIDPTYKHFIMQQPFIGEVKGKVIGVFPLAYSIFLSPFAYKSILPYFPLLSYMLVIPYLFLLFRYWNFSPWHITFVLFCTFTLIPALDVSENSLFVLLNATGLTLWFLSKENKVLEFIAGFLIGFSVFFRLEPILFFPSIGLAVLLIYKQQGIRKSLFPGIGFLLPVIVFLLFNHIHYGHFLGPRFFFNYSDPEQRGGGTFMRIFEILFLGKFSKPGFYVFTPLFLLVQLYYAIPGHFKELNKSEKIFFLGSLIFMLLASFVAPNDGGNTGARYLTLAIFPLLLLSKNFVESLLDKERKIYHIWKSLAFACILFSLLALYEHIHLHKRITKQLNSTQELFLDSKADIWILSAQPLCDSVGIHFFSQPTLCIKDQKSFEEILPKLQKEYPSRNLAFYKFSDTFLDSIKASESKLDTMNELEKEYVRKIGGNSPEVRKMQAFLKENFTNLKKNEKGTYSYETYKLKE